jgi:hypothetical protein
LRAINFHRVHDSPFTGFLPRGWAGRSLTLNFVAPLQFFAVSFFRRKQPMVGVQMQPVTALQRDAMLSGSMSIFDARDDAVLAPHG